MTTTKTAALPPEVAAHPYAELAADHLRQSAALKLRLVETCLPSILQAAERIAACFHAGGRLLLCGNGGSAADCQHMAAEFVSRLHRDVERQALSAIALTVDTSFLTAYTNDVGFEGVFARQVEALGRPGDVLLGISTSGGSANVLRAIVAAHERGMSTIGLIGAAGTMAPMVTIAVRVPSRDTQLIQEAHLAIEHVICEIVERRVLEEPRS